MKNPFIILDFGSQFTKLLARRLRELGFYSEIYPCSKSVEEIKKLQPAGIILSGGPYSVYDKGAPSCDVKGLLDLAPLLGVCYGMQMIAHSLGGVVSSSDKREYGLNELSWVKPFSDKISKKVWMSHGDIVESLPSGFEIRARSSSGHPAAFSSDKVWCVQFHPEVSHTENGEDILKSFAEFCKMSPNWNGQQTKDHILEEVKKQISTEDTILCALSGGVDSLVTATILKSVSKNVHCVFVDTGLLRKNEVIEVQNLCAKMNLDLHTVCAEDIFLKKLKKVSDPEKKRKIIGHTFIDVFKNTVKKQKLKAKWLAQGTLYTDRIESLPVYGKSSVIKSHHNVGGLPKKLNFKLLEPLKDLFKDEVRLLGKELNIPEDFLNRHPFPGPGLALRVIGAVDKEQLSLLREAEFIFIDELKKQNLYSQVWQAFAVLLPVNTVGVQGDFRTYEKVLALRAVSSEDGMTADWFKFSSHFLNFVSNRITNEVKGINRIVYDITSKPPATIEWE